MKVYIHKLGCPKNDVDADYMAARLVAEGHEPVATPEEADSIIVNTCGFILPAKEESINELLRLGQLKRDGKAKRLYASGCLAQRYGEDLLKGMGELDGAFGLGQLDALAAAMSNGNSERTATKIESRKLSYLAYKERLITDVYPYAYLKISDGCARNCSYCAIPAIRGKYRSRPLGDIIREATVLAEHGKREVILVSQESTMWGRDIPGKPSIVDLLEALDKVAGLRWIRLMYLHPLGLNDEVIEYMLTGKKTLAYFDLPLQHINTEVLRTMRRGVDRKRIEQLLARMRNRGRAVTVRTTFIVGFPGETKRQFEELKTFVADYEFDRLGVFSYSKEEGTGAAGLVRQVPQRVKQERLDELMAVQQEIALRNNRNLVGTTVDVMIDSVDTTGVAVGRTAADCPEIDQEIEVQGDGLSVGQIVRVKVTDAEPYDLVGTLIRG
ncbi:MAG TPA: 30S ribosomal protein S12 methylthiotransferase RimO [Candidatus Acidoferrum sp.]|nr:30S ribosomal protein S12 methylthiotransferase RimO [Candidatus Acidoferrum sp.]